MSSDQLPQTCPFADCGRQFSVAASEHGRAVRCPECGRSLTAMHPATVREHAAERLRRQLAAQAAGESPAPAPANRQTDPTFVALLENVRSLWNVGSIFRTADGAGIERLILTGITGHPPRKEISKTALGAEELIDWEYEPDPLLAAQRWRRQGYRLLALETGPGGVPIAEIDPGGPICLIVGHEVAGISTALCDLADARLLLPMRGVKESLNVAVAFGVAAYELAAGRHRLGLAGSQDSPPRAGTEPNVQGKP